MYLSAPLAAVQVSVGDVVVVSLFAGAVRLNEPGALQAGTAVVKVKQLVERTPLHVGAVDRFATTFHSYVAPAASGGGLKLVVVDVAGDAVPVQPPWPDLER